MAIPVLVVVFTIGNWMGRSEATHSIAVEQTAAIYSAEMSGSDLNLYGGRYTKLSKWLTLRRLTVGAVQSFSEIKGFAAPYGLPCGASIKVVRNGKTFDEDITYFTKKFIPLGAS